MRVSELRTACDALSRFATVREKVDGVTSRIGVQAGAGQLKLISGDGTSGMVVRLCDSADAGTFYIDARPFLQGAKVLPAKSEASLAVSPKGLAIRTDSGGELLLRNKGPLSDAGFAKKPFYVDSVCRVSGAALRQAAKLFPAVTRGEEKLSRMYGTISIEDNVRITFVEPRVKTKYASWTSPDVASCDIVDIACDGAFFESLRAIEDEHIPVLLGVDGAIAQGAQNLIYTQNISVTEQWPILSVRGELVSFTMERKRLIDLLKGQAPHDEHNRVVMTWGGDELEIRPFGDEDGMTIPVKTIGNGSRGVSASLMLDMLGGMDDAKVVSVRIAQGSPAIVLSAPEYDEWTLLVAPLIQ